MRTWRAEKRERLENTGLDALLNSSRNLLEGYGCVGQLTCFAWEMITAGMEDNCDQIATHLQTENIATTSISLRFSRYGILLEL